VKERESARARGGGGEGARKRERGTINTAGCLIGAHILLFHDTKIQNKFSRS